MTKKKTKMIENKGEIHVRYHIGTEPNPDTETKEWFGWLAQKITQAASMFAAREKTDTVNGLAFLWRRRTMLQAHDALLAQAVQDGWTPMAITSWIVKQVRMSKKAKKSSRKK